MFHETPEFDRFVATQKLMERAEALAIAVGMARCESRFETLQSDHSFQEYRKDTESGLIFRTMACAWFNRREMLAYEGCLWEIVSVSSDTDRLAERVLEALETATGIAYRAFGDGREQDPFDVQRAMGLCGYAPEVRVGQMAGGEW